VQLLEVIAQPYPGNAQKRNLGAKIENRNLGAKIDRGSKDR